MDKAPNKNLLPLQGFEIALEIYLLLKSTPNLSYTVLNIRDALLNTYGEKIRTRRIKQVCDGLTHRKRIVRVKRINPITRVLVSSYKATEDKTVMIDSHLFELSKLIYEMEVL